MKTAIMPCFSELIIKINPAKEVTRQGLLNIMMPWLYAPWPEAQQRGVVEMEVTGNTLRALLEELARRYKQANVDFEPIDYKTNQMDFDFDVFINDRN